MFDMIPTRCQKNCTSENQWVAFFAVVGVSGFRRTGVRFWDGSG